jgi:hypothetical protein
MVEPETFTFLADLVGNNSKAWMDEHRSERDDAMRNFTGIATTLHDYAHRFDYLVADARSKPKPTGALFLLIVLTLGLPCRGCQTNENKHQIGGIA